MVSRQVLADERGHLQHVETRHGEDRLQRTVGLDDATLVQFMRLDVAPDLLRDLCARKRLRTADGRQSRAQGLLGEDAFPGFFHREGVLLGGRTLSNLARRLLGRLDLLPMFF